MFDIRAVRDAPEAFDAALARRGAPPAAARLIELDDERRAIVTRMQEMQTARNTASKAIGKAKGAGDEAEAQRLIAEVATLKAALQVDGAREREASNALRMSLDELPNAPLDSVPDGPDEGGNVEVRRVGEPPSFGFAAKEHDALGDALGMMDVRRAGRIAGSRFTVLTGRLARLERALGQFMIDLHTTEHGYQEVSVPLLVRGESLYGTGQLPKFEDDLFAVPETLGPDGDTEPGDQQPKRYLIPTAEVPLTNLVAQEMLSAQELPLRVTALTPCFRAEAGSAGRDVRGMLRQHQFTKCELVSIVAPPDGEPEQERMTACAEEVLKRLGLAYRVMELCTGDMGFAARRTYDIEVWLPGQGTYREISSCSLCGDFQARRMNARYRPTSEAAPAFVHTLNGSGVAVGRALIAVMENYQEADGSIRVPDVLVPYAGFERIDAP